MRSKVQLKSNLFLSDSAEATRERHGEICFSVAFDVSGWYTLKGNNTNLDWKFVKIF